MQAIVFKRYGRPTDVLRLVDVPRPDPAPGEVLVKVHATAINDWDWAYVRGKPHIYRLMFGLRRPKVAILGAELAGVVEATGQGCLRFSAGDAVYGDLSEAGFGAFAEYVAVPESALAPKPPCMTYQQAAALPHAAMLAYQGLFDVGQIRRGDRLLINGAGGGVGTIGVQLAKPYASEITGVDSGAKLDMLLSVGFDRVIDYQQEDFTRRNERYNVILDTKTTRPPRHHLRALASGGRYVSVGGQVPRLLQTLALGPVVRRLSGKTTRIVALKANKDLAQINERFESSGLRFVIDGPYPLAEVPHALQHFGEAKHLGKVVITVAQAPSAASPGRRRSRFAPAAGERS